VSSACSYQIALRVRSAPFTRPASGNPIEIYAAAIDTSEYAERLGASVDAMCRQSAIFSTLALEMGQVERALRVFGCRWIH
jgi:hypothetical protein